MRKQISAALCLLAAAGLGGMGTADRGSGGRSRWVYYQPDGKLAYGQLPRGDHIMDFSSAGYGGGGVTIPRVPVVKTVSPSGGDDTRAIQAAIEEVSKLPLKAGFRGTVLLQPGSYTCSGTITLNVSGVVLRGSGDGPFGTVLRLVGKPHQAIAIEGEGEPRQREAKGVKITDAYVPSGSTSFSVANGAEFKTGEAVAIYRPATDKWVHFMGMDTLVRNGKKEHWVSGEIRTERHIKAIKGNRITLDVPLTDSLDAEYLDPPGAVVAKRATTGRVDHVGVEDLRITAPPQHVSISEPLYTGIRLRNAEDAWVRSVQIVDTTSAVAAGVGTARVTVEDVGIVHSTTTVGAAKPADFSAEGTQILFNKCQDRGETVFYFVTGARATGPIVLLNCKFQGGGWIQPHQRWSTGLLVDNCEVPEGGIEFMNRGIMGSGHGWTIGWSVAWNCVAKSFMIERPPGSMNWAIGCRGAIDGRMEVPGSKKKLEAGTYELQGRPASPSSLYLAQLRERAGAEAVRNIGY